MSKIWYHVTVVTQLKGLQYLEGTPVSSILVQQISYYTIAMSIFVIICNIIVYN